MKNMFNEDGTCLYNVHDVYNHYIFRFRAVGEFSPDDEWWGKCKQVPAGVVARFFWKSGYRH